MNPAEFIEKYIPRPEQDKWRSEAYRDMEHMWQTLNPGWLKFAAMQSGVLDDSTLRRYAVWCARQVQHLMTDPRSIAALDVAERRADGRATCDELSDARNSARIVWHETESKHPNSSRHVSALAAWACVDCSAFLAASWTAGYSERALSIAAKEAAETAAEASQAAWLRENATPDWERAKNWRVK